MQAKLVFGFSHGAHACRRDVAFVRVYGRATPDRAGARTYHGIDLYLMLTRVGGGRTETTS